MVTAAFRRFGVSVGDTFSILHEENSTLRRRNGVEVPLRAQSQRVPSPDLPAALSSSPGLDRRNAAGFGAFPGPSGPLGGLRAPCQVRFLPGVGLQKLGSGLGTLRPWAVGQGSRLQQWGKGRFLLARQAPGRLMPAPRPPSRRAGGEGCGGRVHSAGLASLRHQHLLRGHDGYREEHDRSAYVCFRRLLADDFTRRLRADTRPGRELAKKLPGYSFLDTDTVIEAYAGQDCSAIFEKEGEEGFRNIESMVMDQACAYRRLCIATGGGAVLRVGPASRSTGRESGD
eukprot:scaffold2201_cov240-Pinguiococcus_pyrenoidosus.AAC.10